MKPVRFIFTVGALVLSAVVAYAQGGQDFSKVEIKANKVTDKFYTLDGQGGTIGVLIGPDGVFMVDTQFAPLSEKIAAAIKQLTPQPIKFVVNTHVHGDHSGGDENFGKMGATEVNARWGEAFEGIIVKITDEAGNLITADEIYHQD